MFSLINQIFRGSLESTCKGDLTYTVLKLEVYFSKVVFKQKFSAVMLDDN